MNSVNDYDLDIKITIIVNGKGLCKLALNFNIKWIFMNIAG